jgi:DTW domain-containing protein YfiP
MWLEALLGLVCLHAAQAASVSTQSTPLSPAIAAYLQKRQQHAAAIAPEYANRPLCGRCKRSEHVCVCAALPCAPVQTATKVSKIVSQAPPTFVWGSANPPALHLLQVIILQHPAEARRRITSTVPLIGLCLENCDTIISNDFDMQHPLLKAALIAIDSEAANVPLVLYPSEEATFIEDMAPCLLHANALTDNTVAVDNVQQMPYTIILIDGTWSQAKQMIHSIDWLHTHCKPVKFRSGGSSSYTIRREPMPHCLR